MIRLARVPAFLALAGALTPSALTAQDTVWPADVVASVTALVAERLGVPEERVVLSWGPYRGEPVPAGAGVELTGRGSGGHWVARADLPGSRVASVRVRGGARVERPVASRDLARGEALEPTDIAWDERVVWGVDPAEDAVVQPGWVAQRPLRAGDELRHPAVRAPLAVVSGRPVEIQWGRGPVRISVPGTASGSGAVGDGVAVRTPDGARLTGIVRAPGVVDVSVSARALQGGTDR